MGSKRGGKGAHWGCWWGCPFLRLGTSQGQCGPGWEPGGGLDMRHWRCLLDIRVAILWAVGHLSQEVRGGAELGF